MEIKILNLEERRTCHNHFRRNDLFRHWHPILSEIEYYFEGMDAISVWYNADVVLQHLCASSEYRDNELNFIHSEISRTQKKKVVSAIMAVVLTRLMNATEEGHEDEYIPNDLICNAILKKHRLDFFFDKIMSVFFQRDIGNDGKKVVITPSDPMIQNTSLDEMDDVSKKEVQAYVDKVMEVTQGLNVYFKEWDGWKLLWKNICLDVELLNLLKEKSPRGREFNMKMVCNVIGMYAGAKLENVPKTSLNNALRVGNMRSYISNIRTYGTSDMVLSEEQYERIIKMMQ